MFFSMKLRIQKSNSKNVEVSDIDHNKSDQSDCELEKQICKYISIYQYCTIK